LVTIWTIVVSRRISLVTTTWRKYKICQYNNTVYRWVNKFLHASQHIMCRTRKTNSIEFCFRQGDTNYQRYCWPLSKMPIEIFFSDDNSLFLNIFFCQQVFQDVLFHCKSIYVCI
jgi:hypothetical protein